MTSVLKPVGFVSICLTLIVAIVSPILADSVDDSITYDGQQRTFRVYLPVSDENDAALPLVLVLHRGAYSGQQMEHLTGFDTLADQENFIAVYPDGIDGSWNDGLELSFLTTVKENTDDVGFIGALLDHLIATYPVDPHRIYAAGFSSGANLNYLLACQLSDRFAAVAVVASLMMQKVAETCHPSAPVSFLMIQGTADPLFAWQGGLFVIDQVDYGYQYSAAETFNFWLTVNGCSPTHRMEILPDSAPDDHTRVWEELYDDCDAAAGVQLYAVIDGGHNWSGVPSDLSLDLTGNVSRDFDASTVIWQFFAQHSR